VQIDPTILERLEKLSHLHVDPDKQEAIIGQLNDIVAYVENLNELQTDQLDAAFSTLEGGTPLRDDHPAHDPDIPEAILSHAPRHADDFFVVPAIID